MVPIIQALRREAAFLLTDWTAKRIIVLFLLAIVSEYILTDLQTPALSAEGLRIMAESANISAATVIPGLLGGTIWLEPDHVHDLAVSLGILLGISAALILAGRKRYIRNLCILYNLFLLVWIIYNVILMVASLWSPEGIALLHLLDAGLIWFFCIFSFGVFYWMIDAEHQERFLADPAVQINFLFPQTTSTLKGWVNWRPTLIDFIFLSFTFSTAFGPADTQVLSLKAKLLVMSQATISLIIIVTIAAWAIGNI